jgi:methylenetetrahydrofolate reductase (NADPH)
MCALPAALVADYSLDMPGKAAGELKRAQAAIPPGTRVHLGFVDSEDTATRVGGARAIRESGFEPVPIISARGLRSEEMLREFLAGLRAAGASRSVLVVGGDPDPPRGPYPDAMSVISSGLLEEYGVRRVSVAGHPGGHPVAAEDVLWQALADKAAELRERGLADCVITQFGFDASLVLTWLADARAHGVSMPVEVGVPGPAAVRRLLWYAARCDVSVTAVAAREYGLSVTDPAAMAAPDRFIRALASGYDARLHGAVRLHFFSFGGFAATARWVSQFCSS